MEQSNDERLWRIARKRATFRKSLYSYLMIIAFLWAVWWFTSGRHTGLQSYPWPIWVMLGLGIVLGFQYFAAYSGSKQDMAIEEFKKLKEEDK
ncbi:MAG: 2TM domain-containing protein [Sediminibacterium sp.]|nr:2TM domain-containing protein [Sediminibacterium sp.]MDP1810479.1 2TM domain-containing protein [Sediminibacterium sp.]MDP3129550.1 2TM domain-containing protein [Sediminibacterium sp.]MDP3667602.1 2TM domain-containing protein [Sediminibacterium sp.]